MTPGRYMTSTHISVLTLRLIPVSFLIFIFDSCYLIVWWSSSFPTGSLSEVLNIQNWFVGHWYWYKTSHFTAEKQSKETVLKWTLSSVLFSLAVSHGRKWLGLHKCSRSSQWIWAASRKPFHWASSHHIPLWRRGVLPPVCGRRDGNTSTCDSSTG